MLAYIFFCIWVSFLFCKISYLAEPRNFFLFVKPLEYLVWLVGLLCNLKNSACKRWEIFFFFFSGGNYIIWLLKKTSLSSWLLQQNHACSHNLSSRFHLIASRLSSLLLELSLFLIQGEKHFLEIIMSCRALEGFQISRLNPDLDSKPFLASWHFAIIWPLHFFLSSYRLRKDSYHPRKGVSMEIENLRFCESP